MFSKYDTHDKVHSSFWAFGKVLVLRFEFYFGKVAFERIRLQAGIFLFTILTGGFQVSKVATLFGDFFVKFELMLQSLFLYYFLSRKIH